MSTDLFVPPSAEGLPLAALDSATEGADRLDAWALSPQGRNFLAHALVQLARDGWLRTEAGEGFEPVRERETPEPETPAAARVVSAAPDRAVMRKVIARAIHRYDYEHLLSGNDLPSEHHLGEADAVLSALLPPADRAAVLERVRDLHQPMQRGPFTICAHCSGWDGKWRCLGVVTDYPCATLRALDGEAGDGLRRMADEAQQQPEAHSCGNCEGIDPDTCLMNPDRPRGDALKRAHVALAEQAGRDQAALARVRALHTPTPEGNCRNCGYSYDPCPTIAALDGRGVGTAFSPGEGVYGRDPYYDGDEAQQQPDTETRPRRGDQFEAWLKARRDEYARATGREWQALDDALDRYRLHADTGTPLGEHVCEGQAVGDCECLEKAAVSGPGAADDKQDGA